MRLPDAIKEHVSRSPLELPMHHTDGRMTECSIRVVLATRGFDRWELKSGSSVTLFDTCRDLTLAGLYVERFTRPQTRHDFGTIQYNVNFAFGNLKTAESVRSNRRVARPSPDAQPRTRAKATKNKTPWTIPGTTAPSGMYCAHTQSPKAERTPSPAAEARGTEISFQRERSDMYRL